MPRDTTWQPGPRAIVAGAGFGGIAAALRLRARGYDVHLIDRCARLGGRAQVFEREGFRHDAGVNVSWMGPLELGVGSLEPGVRQSNYHINNN